MYRRTQPHEHLFPCPVLLCGWPSLWEWRLVNEVRKCSPNIAGQSLMQRGFDLWNAFSCGGGLTRLVPPLLSKILSICVTLKFHVFLHPAPPQPFFFKGKVNALFWFPVGFKNVNEMKQSSGKHKQKSERTSVEPIHALIATRLSSEIKN